MRTYRKISVVVALAALAAWAAPASATLVNSVALGSDMAGGTLTVTFQFMGGPISAPIVAGPAAGEGSATIPGFFSFSVMSSTIHNTWGLTNFSNDFILVADFNLPPSLSLFDNDTTPSTPDSVNGMAGASYVAGPPEIFSGEYQPWPDGSNNGDMYEGEIIQWDESSFGPGMTYLWRDDTDVIPEPVTLALLCAGGIPVLLRRRRRK